MQHVMQQRLYAQACLHWEWYENLSAQRFPKGHLYDKHRKVNKSGIWPERHRKASKWSHSEEISLVVR